MNLEAITAQLAQTIQKEANINAIFGEPRKLDEHTIVPVARIKISLGAAGGGGTGPAPNTEGEAAGKAVAAALQTVGGTGGGGGLEIEVLPLGFIRDSADGPTFVAIEAKPEGLIGKLEHLLEGLRPGAKPADAGH